MKIVFRISTRLRSAAPTPRDFLPVPGLEHLGLVFNARIYESPEEFNAVTTQLADPRFPSRGCQFFSYALTAEDEAKLAGVPLPAVVVQPDPEPTEPTEPTEPNNPDPAPVDLAPEKFRLEGKGIFMGEDRVAGLYGEDKQLRVLVEFADLRTEIEAWLEASNPL